MVRYSKYAFRELVRDYGTDIVYTPMFVAQSFCLSQLARDADFTTQPRDTCLVAQFGANNAKDFADASELIAPYADAVALNCGCPQSWAMQDGMGSALISKPDLVADMVRAVRNRVGLPVEIKIRIKKDLADTGWYRDEHCLSAPCAHTVLQSI